MNSFTSILISSRLYEAASIPHHYDTVTWCGLSHFGFFSVLVTANRQSVQFWDLQNQELIDSVSGIRFTISPDEQQIAIIDRSSVEFRHIATLLSN